MTLAVDASVIVALAEALECPLATLDSKLTGAGGVRCQFRHP
jgi:predicted nucleic acid-binding protein